MLLDESRLAIAQEQNNVQELNAEVLNTPEENLSMYNCPNEELLKNCQIDFDTSLHSLL